MFSNAVTVFAIIVLFCFVIFLVGVLVQIWENEQIKKGHK